MKHEPEKTKREEVKGARASRLAAFLPFHLLFFVLCFLYLWLVVEPHLIYHGFGTLLPDAPPFATGWSFLTDTLSLPGGPVIYVSGFLSQGYHYSWLGAGIIVLAGFGLSELSRRHLAMAGFAQGWVLAPFPAIMLFLIYSQYHHPLPACLAISLGLALSLIFEKLPLRQPVVRALAGCLIGVAGFWLGNAGTWLVFALMTLVQEIAVPRRWMTVALALPASAAIILALAQYVFLIPARETLVILTPFAPSATAGMDPVLKVVVFLLYGFVPLVVLVVSAGKSIVGRRGPKPDVRSKGTGRVRTTHLSTASRGGAWYAPYRFAKPALAALPIVLMALGLYITHKELRKPYLLSNYYSGQRSWDKILDLNRRLPKNRSNPYVSHDILRALYHTGRLPYDMFCYPLVPEGILLTHEKKESDLTQWKLSEMFLELGHVNMAQKLASEVLTTKGPLGSALEELAWINIIKGHPGTARVYLEALKKDLVYRGGAQSLLQGLDRGFPPEQVAYIDRIRSYVQGETAGVTGTEPVDETLAALLKHNPRNKMAFEYLMACYLLTGQVDRIVANMGRLRDLDYQGTPTLYQEAMLIYFGSQGGEVDPAKFGISPETLRRYEAFVRLGNAMESQDRRAVLNRLIREFGTSYFFYYTFGRVGLN
ncbi:MAG: DUF6057 family protein [Planctomycetes bacterium]|nr:DUF6057 family protein [Planctomycetota bacterium]